MQSTVITLLVIGWTFIGLFILPVSQNGATVAPSADQTRIKPFVEAETKAREALLVKTNALPESAKVKAAKEAYDKAVMELNSAAEKLPEHAAWKQASAKVAEEGWQILADNKLSSLKYRPELNAEGQLVFTKIAAPKQ